MNACSSGERMLMCLLGSTMVVSCVFFLRSKIAVATTYSKIHSTLHLMIKEHHV